MERKLNVALVLGAGYSRRLLEVFSAPGAELEVKALGLLNDISRDSYLTDIPLQTFIEDQHLQGFMLGLEEELAKADIIVASGLADASTYQAFRYAYHHQKPFLLFCQKESELKAAILHKSEEFQDCLSHASGFLVYDQGAVETLEYMGVALDKIQRLSPEIDARKFGFHEKLRQRFRGYLKQSSETKLVLAPLTDDSSPLEIMTAFKMLEGLDPDLFANTRLVFTGNPESKDKVKYRAVDLNLTKSILFIAQDVQPFYLDLLAATDLYISLSREGEETEVLFASLEAMATGARILVDAEHPLADRLTPKFVIPTRHQFALSLRDALKAAPARDAMMDFVATHFQSKSGSPELMAFLRGRVAKQPGQLPLAGDFAMALQELQQASGQDFDDFEAAFQRQLGIWGTHGEYRAKLQLVKANTCLAQQKLDEALLAFELCTADTIVQREAYLGLGKIAFLTQSYDEALSFYRKALALKPNDAEAMGSIGLVYRKMRFADEAVYWLGKAISVDTENSRYLSSLTQACLESDDFDRSISLLEQLKVLFGNKPVLVMCLGQLYLKAGNTERGKELIDLALEITMNAVPSLSA